MRVLLVDGSALLYQTYSALGHLKNSAGELTGVRFQFLRTIRAKQREYKVDKIVVVWDSPGAPVKAMGVSEYKSNRKQTDEKVKMYAQLPALKEMLGLTFYSQAEAVGYEADDVIGSITRKITGQGHVVYIMSPDNDFMQLVGPLVCLIQPKKKGEKKDHVIYADDVMARLGVKPVAALLYRAMKGDTSDNLKAGVSLKTDEWELVKRSLNSLPDVLYRQHTADAVLSTFLANTRTRQSGAELPVNIADAILSQRTEIELNYDIMRLHDPTFIGITKGRQDTVALLDLFEKLEFKSLIPHVEHFTNLSGVLRDNLEAYATAGAQE